MTDFFRFLVETNLVTAAFVIGAIAFVIAIIGKVKTIIEPSPTMRFLLAVFGLFLMVLSLGSYFVSSQTKPNTPDIPIQKPTSAPIVQPINSPASQSSFPTATITPFCAFLTRSQVEELKNIQGVSEAIKKAEEFSGFQQNNYNQGYTIPVGVLIATDLRTTNIEQFGVVPINRQGGWGLFITTVEFQAPNAGTYWCIHEQ